MSLDLDKFNETAVASVCFYEVDDEGVRTDKAVTISKAEWVGDKARFACSNALVRFFAELTTMEVPTPEAIRDLMDEYGIYLHIPGTTPNE